MTIQSIFDGFNFMITYLGFFLSDQFHQVKRKHIFKLNIKKIHVINFLRI